MSKHPRAMSANLSELPCGGGTHTSRAYIPFVFVRCLCILYTMYCHAPSGVADRVVQSTRAHLSYPHANVFTHVMICFFKKILPPYSFYPFLPHLLFCIFYIAIYTFTITQNRTKIEHYPIG